MNNLAAVAIGADEKDAPTPDHAYCCPACGWSPSPRELAAVSAAGLDGTASFADWDHCPNCLCSTHKKDADDFSCGGTLQPVSIWVRPNDSWEIVQRCSICGELGTSPMSEDDSPVKLLSLAFRPLSNPPFPLERMEEMTALMGGQGDVEGYYDEPRA